jgi:tryptophan 2-C-methyltransferase
MNIALVNTNRIQPPIAPIGLDYVAEALHAAGHSVTLLDLCWEDNPKSAINRFFKNTDFGLVGMTLRNTDDCAFSSRESFLPGFIDMVKAVHENSGAPIVLGGVGFSVMPEFILDLANADFGIWGEGEFVLPELARRLEKQQPCQDLPNLVWRYDGKWRKNPPSCGSLAALPPMRRTWVDNRRYFRYEGQAGFETKRGCSGRCIYCADPLAKGSSVRVRQPAAVADELECLIGEGIDALHICDGEFNIPEKHALAVCHEIARRGLAEKIRWYTYCAPAPFSQELAKAMRVAGCAGIKFGADNGNDGMLKRLGRDFNPIDISNAARWTKEEGMFVMLDLLLGAPGETIESIQQTVELVKQADPDLVGISLGVRVYPGTGLATQAAAEEYACGLVGGKDPFDPLFFLEPQIVQFVFDWINALNGDDDRFLFFDPSRPKQNYNYNSNQRLIETIAQGYHGAFCDILHLYEKN